MNALFASALALLLVTACGGGSNGSDGRVASDDAPADGVLSGRVLDAVADAPLAGVAITLRRAGEAADGTPLATMSSGSEGTYRFDTLSRNSTYQLEFSVAGYLDERFERIAFTGVSSGADLALEPVRLVSEDNAGSGALEGTITGAVDGQPLAGLTLNFRRGINVRDGEIVATAFTDANGRYAVDELGYGNVTCEIVGDGLQTTYTTLQVLGDIVRDEQNGTISPRVETGDTRIVLSWGATPRDLDSHLTGPGTDGDAPFHVFYADATDGGANLDVDDTSSFGPETITFDASRDGVYRYSVHRFSSGTPDTLSLSGARVQVIRAEGTVADFFVPRGEGDLWTVFDMIGGEILPINEISRIESVDDYFAPELRQRVRPTGRVFLAPAKHAESAGF